MFLKCAQINCIKFISITMKYRWVLKSNKKNVACKPKCKCSLHESWMNSLEKKGIENNLITVCNHSSKDHAFYWLFAKYFTFSLRSCCRGFFLSLKRQTIRLFSIISGSFSFLYLSRFELIPLITCNFCTFDLNFNREILRSIYFYHFFSLTNLVHIKIIIFKNERFYGAAHA